jgi:deazaflavin-dependent oxidoreductase (nitroreductase family)
MTAGLYRLTGGRSGRHALLITTLGAKSNEPRVAHVRRFDDGPGRWLVVGSAGGSARHPGWVHNVAKHPDQVWVEIGKQKSKVRAELLHGDERAEAWKRIVQEAPNFGKYEHTTDREIPVLRLTREP